MTEDPSHRHGYDRDSLMDWRKALPKRPGPNDVDRIMLATLFAPSAVAEMTPAEVEQAANLYRQMIRLVYPEDAGSA